MEKQNPTIKIFVSHRIDLDAASIDNPLYVPVRCGACYDKRKSDIIGDDTGDNISQKRMSFNELTVLYWAWKNQKADYYGLCHYRRYIAFDGDKQSRSRSESNNGCIEVENLDQVNINKYGLTKELMSEEISRYDAIFIQPINLKQCKLKSNYEAMEKAGKYHFIKDVDLMLDVIRKKYPHMYATAKRYMFNSNNSYLYNCFIMKSDIFNAYCEWLFDVLFEIEKHIDMSVYSTSQYRTPGTLSERLLGIWILWLKEQNKYKIKENPLLFINDASKIVQPMPAFDKNNIVIASNFNDGYVPIFSIFLQSVIEHASPENNYDIFVLGNDITEKSQRMLKSIICGRKNFSLRFLKSDWTLRGIKKEVKIACYTDDLYYRIVIPYILQNFDKILVVDADMVCREDIANLYNEDVSDYMAAGVKDVVFMGYLNGMDPTRLSYCKSYMKLTNPYNYINTGTLLFNATKFKKKYSLSELKEFISLHMSSVKIWEQDMLNMLLQNDIKFLPAKWNCYTKTNDFVARCLDVAPCAAVQEWKAARDSNAGIIHYAASPKPWFDPSSDFADLFWIMARKTPFYEEILLRMNMANMGCPVRSGKKINKSCAQIRFKRALYRGLKHLTAGRSHKKFKKKYNRYNQLYKSL